MLGWGMCHRQRHGLLSHYRVCISVTREEEEKEEGGVGFGVDGGIEKETGGGLSNLTISHTRIGCVSPPLVQFTTWELLALLWHPKGRNATSVAAQDRGE